MTDALVSSTATSTLPVPALIAGAGESAAWRFLEFSTVNIRNPHTRAAASCAGARIEALYGWKM